MIKLIRHAGAVGASAALVGGALLAGAGSASATPQHAPGTGTRSAAVRATSVCSRQHHRLDPWIEGQLARFDPAAKRKLAVYDPWVKDQLALYAPTAC
ncbi:hypothetical protein HZZ00_15230 [Streptomyces sp. NEAU-sy36]|uniref:hypothetical protein n=1 Tax=unclassified Streptomyces TaxID=2593676 RepID=UPI0015D65158|nr:MULTISPECIES: hypothetical protein [unclassified Streptomyces]QLJ02248.1 hypothetical protein HZZ00_15230 [Streptomyces sp. NEAU-sy36]